MTDPYFSHDRNGNRLDDLFDHLGVALERESAKKMPRNKKTFSTGMHGDGASHLPYARHRLLHEYLQAHVLVP